MKITPLNDRVVLKRQAAESKTAGGIILPGGSQEKPTRGTVVAVGEGRRLDNGKIQPLEVKVGDLVSYSTYAGSDIKVAGEEYVILREDDILGIFLKEAVGARKKKK